MTPDILDWLSRVVEPLTVDAKLVYEIGALDVNGSARDVLHKPAMRWVGMDYQAGKGVDVLVDAGLPFNSWFKNQVLHDFRQQADLVISCEALEHDADPYGTVMAMQRMVRMGGYMVITTPGQSFPYHAYPHDFFRVGKDWLQHVAFGGWKIIALEQISREPYTTLVGVAQKI